MRQGSAYALLIPVLMALATLFGSHDAWAGGNLSIFEPEKKEPAPPQAEQPAPPSPPPAVLPPHEKQPLPPVQEDEEGEDGWEEDSIYDNDKSC